ncbi:hypothetical protein NLU13_1040 [Sarocladium strictum]|uniref:Uncharacterized protein n=1 Tax=Sarocladium strictum TaxID=5046 RepID=A0AA39GQ73_SARSR|nr:hypothetical protein NLU13_1040 [Sarocladium strictum]
MCNYKWLELVCPCDKGRYCCMRHKPQVVVDDRYKHSTEIHIPIKESGQRCQYRRKNAKGGWADPKCKYSEKKDIVGTRLSDTLCLWCSMDCAWAPVDDHPVREALE